MPTKKAPSNQKASSGALSTHYTPCVVCSEPQHYRYRKRHLVKDHGWRYINNPDEPENPANLIPKEGEAKP